jgi:hypothetical protein
MILVSTNDGCFGGRRAVGKPRGRREGAVWKNAVYLLQIWNRKAVVMMKRDWGKEIGEAKTANKNSHKERSMASNDKIFVGG